MSASDRSGRWLFYTIVGVLLLAMGSLIWSAVKLRQRQKDLSELALQRTQQILQVRLDGLFHELEEDLLEEAAAVEMDETSMVSSRWLPLLRTHWPIMAIRLADENGNEIALAREDSTFLLSRTAKGSKEGPPILMRYNGGSKAVPIKGPWLGTSDNDPRERVWFSKALEDTRNEPSWTLRTTSDNGQLMLQLSYLIREEDGTKPYRIIAFMVDISRSLWMDPHSAALHRAGILLMDDEGRSLCEMSEPSNVTIQQGLHEALEIWRTAKTTASFEVSSGDADLLCRVWSYALNGQQLSIGVVIDQQQLSPWIMPERIGLIVAGILLASLIVLLIAAWNRKRSSDERIRKQAKRNRSQEMKLAKALGEREVLNREVHHRVKNNLQVVSSLLNLQAMRLDEGLVKNEFLRGKRRIDTIALVHHKLYGLADLRNVDLKLFFTDLVKALAEMYNPKSRTVSTEIDTDAIKADQDTAIELGIILCELLANTYQHAFPYAAGGHVEIKVRIVEGDLYRLTMKDNGKGIAEGEHQGTGKLGLEIVEALSEQLDGSFHMRSNGGVLFEVLFRMQREPLVSPNNDLAAADQQ